MIASHTEKVPTTAEPRGGRWAEQSPLSALAVFVVVELLALALFLWVGRDQWFVLDEWDFLEHRSLSFDDVMRPHYGHWVSLPVVSYRLLYRVFGLTTYVPYQLLAIAGHLAVAALARVLMRRAGVGPWLATAFAALIALFGAGEENVVWAFQITFTAALTFGMAHVILADHDGPFDRRDWLGLFAGLAAVMCSVPGMLMVFPVGLATLLRRGWRIAALHTLPLIGVVAVWAVIWEERDTFASTDLPGLGAWFSFVGEVVLHTFDALGPWWPVGAALAVVLIVGLVVSFRDMGRRAWVVSAAPPLALFVTGWLFLIVTGSQRAEYFRDGGALRQLGYELPGRYLYMAAAMFIPLIAFGAQGLVRRWPRVTPLVLLLPLLGVTANVADLGDRPPESKGDPGYILTVPRVPAAGLVPRDTPAGDASAPGLTVGFLREGVLSGRVPMPENMDDADVRRAIFTLNFEPTFRVFDTTNCEALSGEQDIELVRGDVLVVGGQRLGVVIHDDWGDHSGSLPPNLSYVTRAEHVRMTTDAPVDARPARVCR